jgi:hypothetical protein
LIGFLKWEHRTIDRKKEENGKFRVLKKRHFNYSLVGYFEMIKQFNFSFKKIFKDVDELDGTCLYIAAQYGFYEICRYFFFKTVKMNIL